MCKIIRLSVFVLFLMVMASTVFCQTWQPSVGPEGGQINSLVLNSQGDLFATVLKGGVYKSTDGGEHWTWKSGIIGGERNSNFYLNHLAYSPFYNSLFVGNACRIWRSSDNGENWSDLINVPNYGCWDQAIKARPSDGLLFAACMGVGIIRSDDNGDTWVQVGDGIVNPNVTSLGFNNLGHIYAGTSAGVYVSTDDGDSWSIIPGSEYFDVTALGVDPFDNHLHIGTHGGGLQHGDTYLYDGIEWTRTSNEGWDSKEKHWVFYHATDLAFDGNGAIYISTFQNSGVSRSLDHGATWSYIGGGRDQVVGGGGLRTFFSVVVAPNGTVFAGSSRDGVFKWTGITTDFIPEAVRLVQGMPAIDVTSLLITNDDAVLAGTSGSGIFRSPNMGEYWDRVSADLINECWPILSIATNRKNQAFAAWGGIVRSDDGGITWPSPYDSSLPVPWCCAYTLTIGLNDEVYAGGAANVFKSIDDGYTWENLWDMAGSDARSMAVDAEGRIFVGVLNNGLFSGIYRSEDNGYTWEQVGLSESYFIHSIAVSPNGDIFSADGQNIYKSIDNGDNWIPVYYGNVEVIAINTEGRIFAGGGGIVTSTDNGATWQAFDDGLTNWSIESLAFDADGYLYAGHGGGGVSITTETTFLVKEVEIDIKPGEYPNTINLGSNGTVTVAILGSSEFDATTVDPLSVTLSGAIVKLKGNGESMASIDDVDKDGYKDLLVHVLTTALQLSNTDTTAILLGKTYEGRNIKGQDTVRILQ